jgi:methyltransferase-like protein/trans-aconitate methyltransferase
MENSLKQTSYDEIPYESHPFPQSHPDRLATLGCLFGLSPAPVTQCRVLELGCASGGNLVPMAYHLPESDFVGFDLSKRQVEMGRKVIKDLNLKNIHIEHASIMDIGTSWGVFDYIISHGVYSWVPDEVQDKILVISSGNLAPQGIAYVSYNTYPGWHMREMIRRMMLYHSNQFEKSKERIEQARALMDFLANSVPTENNYYGLLLKNELELIKRSRDWYIFHDHLENVNEPVYFYQFIEQADQHGLQYLGEADFSTMLTSGFSEEVAETLGRISQNIIHTEQYMDFIRNRFFRQTLLCHKGLTLKRDLVPDDVNGMLIASAASPEAEPVNLSPGIRQSFRTPEGSTVETPFPLTKAGLIVLRERWPRVIDFDTLFREASERLKNFTTHDVHQSKGVFSADLLHCYSANVVAFHTWQADFVTEISDKPRVSKLAAYLRTKERAVVNQRHEVVNLDPVSKQLVRILDGTKDHTALLKRLNELVEDGTLVVHQDHKRLTNGERVQDALAEALEQALAKLAGAALLVE